MAQHIIQKKVTFAIFLLLLALTYTTYRISFLDLGRWNVVVAMGIAASKASLVGLFFMHLWFSSRLIRLVVVSGFFWLAILLTLTLSDYLTRR